MAALLAFPSRQVKQALERIQNGRFSTHIPPNTILITNYLTTMLNSHYQKIHIIGGAGSGKTTLANWFVQQSHFPCFYLDQVGWNESGKVPLSKRQNHIDRILAQPQWVTEGVFLWWVEPLLENSDLILWLDLPFTLTSWRIIKRHTQASWQGNNPHAGFQHLLRFIYSVGKQYYRRQPLIPSGPDDDFAITRVATRQSLKPYSQKVVHCQKPKDVAQFQKQIQGGYKGLSNKA